MDLLQSPITDRPLSLAVQVTAAIGARALAVARPRNRDYLRAGEVLTH